MLRHSDLVTSSGSPLPLTLSERHGRVPIAVGATARAGGDGCGREKIQPVKGRVRFDTGCVWNCIRMGNNKIKR